MCKHSTMIHIYEEQTKIEVSNLKQFENIEYRTLDIGEGLTIFMDEDQVRELIDKLAKATYGKKWDDLTDEIYSLKEDKKEVEQDLEVALEQIA